MTIAEFQSISPSPAAFPAGWVLGSQNSAGEPEPRDQKAMQALVHDVRGPLANLSLLVEALGERGRLGEDEKSAKLVDRALHAIDRLNDMLSCSLARAREDHACALKDPVSLNAIVQEAMSLNEPLADCEGVALGHQEGPAIGLRGDKDLLTRAIDNLLTNAIKFTPAGGRVTCHLYSSGGEAVIRIEDEGPGLTKADLAKLFQPFTQLSAQSGSKLGSHGLGLSLVRQVTEQHGGSVKASNRLGGVGAVFVIRLPLGEDSHSRREGGRPLVPASGPVGQV